MARAARPRDGPVPTEMEAPEALARYLRLLGNPKRIRLLRFLARPRGLDDVAAELGLARQTAHEHLQQLVEAGVVQPLSGRRPGSRGLEWVAVPQRLFAIHEEFAKLGIPEVDQEMELRLPTSRHVTQGGPPLEEDLPRLTIVRGLRVGRTEPLLGEGPWLVGREPGAAVCLDYDPFVSTRHAEVRRVPGGFQAADLYSSNGTFLDWKPLPRGGAQALRNGSVIRTGKTLLLFRRPE